ncbi:MAG: chemotaxis protein CheD [Paracoccaceae bacterium]
MTTEKLHVTIGQVKVAKAGQSLHAILGSCIGIGFLFAERGVYGLAHCLLSKSQTQATGLSGRHVDSAISSLSSMMSLTPADRRKVGVFLAGGANMTMPDDTDPKRLVGQVNSAFALKTLKEAGFRIRYDDLGGNTGRQVTINCNDGTYAIAKIPRLGG